MSENVEITLQKICDLKNAVDRQMILLEKAESWVVQITNRYPDLECPRIDSRTWDEWLDFAVRPGNFA